MITREYTGNYRNDNDEENDESAWVGGRGKAKKENGGGRSATIGIINDRNRTKMRTGRVRRRR